MSARIMTFKYTKTGSDGLVDRKLLVLNEDATRVGGLEITGASDEELETLEESFKDYTIRDFSRQPKSDEPKENKFDYAYRAFSKVKISQYNK